MKKEEVKYLGIVVGHSYDGQTIEFLNNEYSKKFKEEMLKGQRIGISSRRLEVVDEDELVNLDTTEERGGECNE